MEYIIFILALVIIIKSSDIFLDNSIILSKILKIPEVVIGATVVSIGTTLPEIMVSSTSAILGHSDISYGNAIGSIICNTSLICSISLLYKSVKVNAKELRFPTIFFSLATIILCINVYIFKYFHRLTGIMLVIMAAIYFYLSSKYSKTEDVEELCQSNDNKEEKSIPKILLYLFISSIFIGISARLMTDNSIIIARNLGMSEADIGLTIVAFGTSLPELMTAIQSIIKGHSNLSLGNILGANLINLLLVIGISSFISPYKLPINGTVMNINASMLIDIPLLIIVMTILLLPIFINKKTSRWQGAVLICIYFVYIFFLYKFQ